MGDETETAATITDSADLIKDYFKPKPSEMSLLDIKSLYISEAASWAVVTHGILWTRFLSPTFCNMFLPLSS
jgi:hypothetical protein